MARTGEQLEVVCVHVKAREGLSRKDVQKFLDNHSFRERMFANGVSVSIIGDHGFMDEQDLAADMLGGKRDEVKDGDLVVVFRRAPTSFHLIQGLEMKAVVTFAGELVTVIETHKSEKLVGERNGSNVVH